MASLEVPIWNKYTLSLEEASAYFRVGTQKLRKIANENPGAEYLIWNGHRPQFKRVQFEQYIDRCNAI